MPEKDSLKKISKESQTKIHRGELVGRKLKCSCGHFYLVTTTLGSRVDFLAISGLRKDLGVILTIEANSYAYIHMVFMYFTPNYGFWLRILTC